MTVRVRGGRMAVAVALVAVALVLAAPRARGQDGPPEARDEQAEGGARPETAPDQDAPAIQPDAISSFQTRAYRIRPRKLWEGLLQIMKEKGHLPEEVDESGLRVKTSFVDFTSADYSEEVAEGPPRQTPEYQVMQMMKVRAGKVSLEAVVAPEKNGAALSLRARILVQGLDRRRRILVLADRRSSGVIEADFLRHLEDTLKLKRL